MIKELRTQLADYGVPRKLIRSFQEAARSEVIAELHARIDAAERRELAASDEAMQWRLKHNAQQMKAQKFELQIALADEKLKCARKAVTNMAAYCKKLRHQIFGDTSERGASQHNVPNASPLNADSSAAPKRGKKPGTPGNGRKRDSANTQVINHDLDEADKFCRCGQQFDLTDLPPVTSYETHLHEDVVVREHIRRKVIRHCKKCGRSAGVKTAKAPDKIIPKGKYSVEFWRYLIEEKFWLQRPLNRARKKLKTLGATVSLGTITNGFQLFHKRRIFEVVYEALVDRSRLAELRKMDDTGWKVFAETADKHSSRWCMWVSLTCDVTVFTLDPRRSNEVIAEHLQGVSEGIIVCDRHSSFKCFAKNNPNFIIAFCWIHQRRDFINLQIGHPTHFQWADTWLARIDALIAQNKVRVAAIAHPEQFKLEDAILRKMIDEFKKSFETGLADTSLTQEQRAELESLKAHWSGLTVFVDRPYVPMSNNEAERALRDAVLGRKSYYGSRALWSGYQTSWLFSIYATLEQHDIDPHKWMGEYLQACAENNGLPPPDKELQRFLPWNYKAAMNSNQPKESPEPNIPSSPKPAPNPVPFNISIMREEVLHHAQPPPRP